MKGEVAVRHLAGDPFAALSAAMVQVQRFGKRSPAVR